MNFQCEGIVHLKVVKNNIITKELEFKNIITDAGMDNIASTSVTTLVNTCKVGDNATTPVASDTSLAGTVFSSATIESTSTGHSSGSPEWYRYARYSYAFGVGAVVGDVAEIGFFNTSSVLFSRALIKDGEGNPTTLTLLADEQLFVTYEFRKYPPVGISYPLSLKTNLEYEDYTYTVYPAKINTTSSSDYWYSTNSMAPNAVCYWYETDTFVDETNTPPGTASAGMTTVLSYTSGSFTRTIACIAGPEAGNFNTGIGSIYFASGFQIYFNPKIPKTNEQRLVLNFNITWSRR